MSRETFEGKALRRRNQRRLRIGVALGSLLLAAPALPNSQSAAVVQVRVGKHPTYTRVVFELDEPVDYAIRPAGEASREIVVDLDAGSARRVMTSRSDLVESVSIQPADGGAVAHIRLRQAPVQVTEMVLTNPARIVLDLRAEAPATAASEPTTGTPATEEPVETAQPDEGVPAGGPSLVAAGGPDVSAGATPTREPPNPFDEPPLDAGEPDLDSWDEPDAVEPVAIGTETAGGEEPGTEATAGEETGTEATAGELAAGAPLDGEARLDAGLEEPTGSEVEPLTVATEPSNPWDEPLTGATDPSAAPTTSLQPSGGEVPALAMLPEPLRDPRVLLALGGALVVAVLLAAWNRSRRRDKRGGLFSTAIPHLSDVEPVVEARPEPFEDQTLPSIAQAEPDLPGDRSLFDSTVGIEDAGGDEDEKPEVLHDDGGVTPPGVSMPSSQGSVGEVEQRLLGLERRLEEVMDAKDRLERHVAAQTEELRVQRAAIARTQRVLRNLTRPDDAPTEPALKAPQDS